MAESVIKKEMYDTKWQSLNTYCEYRKIGNIVSVRLAIPGGYLSTTWQTIAILPSGYRPTGSINNCLIQTSGNCTIDISSNGNIQVYGTYAYSVSTEIMFLV